MVDPALGAGAIKAIMAVGPMTIKAIAQEWARRDANARDFATLEPELDEALDVLASVVARSPKQVANKAKALLSGVPQIFSDPQIGKWVAAPSTRSAIKSAVQGLMAGDGADAVSARATTAEAMEDSLRPATAVAFDYAVAFVSRSLDRKLSVGERVALSKLDGIGDQIASLTQAIQQSPLASGLQLDLLDQVAIAAIERVGKRRFFEGADTARDAAELAYRLINGDLAGASLSVRARGLACCARWVALIDKAGVAENYLNGAIDLGGGEEALVADAIIAIKAGEAAALAKLAPINTDARREAALVIVRQNRGPAEAIKWAEVAGIEAANLTSDGHQHFLHYAIQAGEWSTAYKVACGIAFEATAASPALSYSAAIARLGNVVPPDQRFLLRSGPPFEGATFNLADSDSAFEDRRAAANLLEAAASVAEALDLPEAANQFVVYCLWLRLRDPQTAVASRIKLERLLEDSRYALTAVPLALSFGLPIDRARVTRELDRREALEPNGSMEVAVARFSLLNIPDNPEAGLEDLRRYRSSLEPYITGEALLAFEFNLLMHLERYQDAETLLDVSNSIEDADLVRRLRTALTSDGDGPRLEDLEQWYAADPNSLNLRRLVERLSRTPDAPQFFEMARRLVLTTRAVADAEQVVALLLTANLQAEVALLLGDISDLLPASLDLQAAMAWSEYRNGELAAAWERVTRLRVARDERNDRALFANILIMSGRWPELVGYVEQEWENRGSRSPEQLIEVAKLAAELGSSRAGEFVQLAAAAAPDNAHIQFASYTLAVQVGNEEQAGIWLRRTIELSDESGPLTRANLQDIVDQSGDWRRHTDHVWAKLRAGEAPLFVGAQLLRRSDLELQLVPLISNPSERDPRKRSVVPAYSGARGDVSGEVAAIALDGSSVVTLGYLGVLDAVLEHAGPVIVPHSTFGWLFTERQKLRFHQPSRIREARALVQAVAAKRLQIFVASSSAAPELIDEIGKDLAEMLESALTTPSDAGPRFVVRSAPVTRVGSFLSEAVDLRKMTSVLVSCARVVDKLAARGHLTEAEEARARTYLAQQEEQRWPDEPEIPDNAVLYLDDLSVDYLRTIGVLEKLQATGLVGFVSARELDESNALLELEARGADIEAAIEKIRKPLAEAVKSGAARLAPVVDGPETYVHPNIAVARASTLVDVIVSDDRFINKTHHIEDSGARAEVWTSIDLIERMRCDGNLSEAKYLKIRTDLRRGGHVFIPPTQDELKTLVSRARARDGALQETAELRAFRENLQIAQMRGWLHLPTEAEWLNRLQTAVIGALLAQWEDTVADEDARARSMWLLHCGDARNWVTLDHGDPASLAVCGPALLLNRLLISMPAGVSPAAAPRFEAWLEAEVLAPMKDLDPDAFNWMLTRLRNLILDGAAASLEGAVV